MLQAAKCSPRNLCHVSHVCWAWTCSHPWRAQGGNGKIAHLVVWWQTLNRLHSVGLKAQDPLVWSFSTHVIDICLVWCFCTFFQCMFSYSFKSILIDSDLLRRFNSNSSLTASMWGSAGFLQPVLIRAKPDNKISCHLILLWMSLNPYLVTEAVGTRKSWSLFGVLSTSKLWKKIWPTLIIQETRDSGPKNPNAA